MKPIYSILALSALAITLGGKAYADSNPTYEVNVELDLVREKDHARRHLSPRDHNFIELMKERENHFVVRLINGDGKRSNARYLIAKEAAEEIIHSAQEQERREYEAIQAQNAHEWESMMANAENLDIPEDVRAAFSDVTGDNAGSKDICSLYSLFKSKINEKSALIPLKQALNYYRDNSDKFANKRYVAFADYSQSSTKKRLYLLDLATGTLVQEKVSHGTGINGQGDPEHDGYLKRCSLNGKHTNFTRAGFFRVANYYYSAGHEGKWPNLAPGKNGMRLEGLSPSNVEAMDVGVVMHEAYYNQGNIMGRSWGCSAFPPGKGAPIIAKLKGGALFYGYAPQCKPEYAQVMKQIKNWEDTCNDGANKQEPSVKPGKKVVAPVVADTTDEDEDLPPPPPVKKKKPAPRKKEKF